MSFWKKVKQKLIEFLSDEDSPVAHPLSPEQAELLERETTNRPESIPSMAQNPGLDCPECGFRIMITMTGLLSGEPVVCPACSLLLHIHQEESKECLDEVRKLDEALKEAEEKKQSAF